MKRGTPRISVAVCTYNHGAFVAEALSSVLSQEFQCPIEIVLSDDASTDRTFEVAQEITASYCGPHVVRLYRNEVNQGFARNLNIVTGLANGDLVIFSSGDDISERERVTRLWAEYERSGATALAIFSNAMVIDEQGKEEGLLRTSPPPSSQLTLDALARGAGVGLWGAFSAFDRRVFDLFAPLESCVKSEDAVYTFRAALLGEVRYVDAPLVRYRRHGNNMGLTADRDIRGGRHFLALVDRHTESRVAVHEANLADLVVVQRLAPERVKDFEAARREVQVNLKDMLLERQMFKACGLDRMRLLARAAVGPTRKRRVARWALWFLMPGPYISLRKARSRISRGIAARYPSENRYWRR